MIPLHITWTDASGAQVYQGGAYCLTVPERSDLSFGVLAPGSYSDPFTVVLRNTAQDRRNQMALDNGIAPDGAAEIFSNIKLYLQADTDTLQTLLTAWPQLNAGVEISFDGGMNWIRFTTTVGNPADAATWLGLPGPAVCLGSPDGQLGPNPPYNRATLQLRVKTPANLSVYGLLQFSIVPDFDVI